MAPTIDDVMKAAVREDKFLASMRRRHKERMIRVIRKLEDKMITLTKSLEVDGKGKLIGPKVNLKQAQEIHKRMLNLFEEEYGPVARELIDDFDEVARHIRRSWADLDEAVTFTRIDRQMMQTLKGQTFDQYAQFGTAAQQRIAEAMYGSVAGATGYADLIKTVQGILTGHKDIRGRPMTQYMDTFAFDSVMNFQNEVNIRKAEDLGFTHFLYVGDIISTSRSFCISRAGKVFSKEEIESWNDMSWTGKSGPPFLNRGGYNCRHHWRGVKPEWIPEGEIEVGDYFEEQEG